MSDSDATVLDVTVLADLEGSVGGDRGFVAELIETFLAEGNAQVEAIGAAHLTGDAHALVRPAHTLKSSSATLGAVRLAAGARELEMAGRSGSLDAETGARIERLQAEWSAASGALRAWLAGGGEA